MTAVAERVLYAIPDVMARLSMSRSVIYEQIRAGRPKTVHQGRRCNVTATAMEKSYVAAGPSQCAAIFPCGDERRRARRPIVDPSGAAAQLRLAHVRRWRAGGGHLAPRRAPQHDRDRVRLPQAATPNTDPRDRGDGPTLPGPGQIF